MIVGLFCCFLRSNSLANFLNVKVVSQPLKYLFFTISSLKVKTINQTKKTNKTKQNSFDMSLQTLHGQSVRPLGLFCHFMILDITGILANIS